MINITQETANILQTLINDAFDLNSKLDRAKTILLVNLKKPNISKIIHDIAHFYSLTIADGIGDIFETYGGLIEYGGIEKHTENFESIDLVIDSICEGVLEFQNELNMASKIAFNENDVHIFQELLRIIDIHNYEVQKVLLLKDLILEFRTDASLDGLINEYIKVGV